jgi:hypothetical protein
LEWRRGEVIRIDVVSFSTSLHFAAVDLSRFVLQRIRGINGSVVSRSDERWNSTARLFRGDKSLVASRGPNARYSLAAALAGVGKEKEKGKKINGKLR